MTAPRNQAAVNALRMIPAKWAVVLVGIAITYVVLQPKLNQWFGWSLPSVAAITGDEKTPKKSTTKEDARKSTKTAKTKDDGGRVDESKSDENDAEVTSKKPSSDTSKEESRESTSQEPAVVKKPTQSTKTATKAKEDTNDDDSEPLYGFLKDLGRSKYESPAGLVYGPGSEEGHRLKHIARHLEDQPNRPGSHGVFKGAMKQFLMTIDDGYARAKKGVKGTTMKEDDGSVVYEVTFDKPIGFIGGETGGRKKNPAAKKLRLVVRGSNVITAFPF